MTRLTSTDRCWWMGRIPVSMTDYKVTNGNIRCRCFHSWRHQIRRLQMRAVTNMRQAIALALLAVALAAGTHGAVAHDFWLQPNEFWVRPEATVPITLQVGHGPT